MPYFSSSQLSAALEAMRGINPILVSILAMLLKKVPETNVPSQAVPFGAGDENKLLSTHFKPVGTPIDRPYYIPFGDGKSADEHLRDKRYSSRTLQKLRTKDWGELFLHPTPQDFAFKQGIAALLTGGSKVFPAKKIPLTALTVWMKRRDDVASVQSAISAFTQQFNLGSYGLSAFFKADDIAQYSDNDLRTVPLTDQEIADLLELAAPPPSVAFTQEQLEERIADTLEEQNIRIDRSLISGILAAWFAHDIAVLVGSPGTGKSTIGRAVIDAAKDAFDERFVDEETILVDSDFDVTRFIGYANLEGNIVPSVFTQKFLLDETKALNACFALLDEWNLASIDQYMAPVLAAIENGTPITLPGRVDGRSGAKRTLPIDTFIIATCNSYVEEPETRTPLSRPVKRRCTIFYIPNWLAVDAQDQGIHIALTAIGNRILEREHRSINDRMNAGAATSVDQLRASALAAYSTYDQIDDPTRQRVEQIVSVILSQESGKRFLTIGVFKDILLNTLYASEANREKCLAQQVAGKIIPLYQGPVAVLQPIVSLFSDADAQSIISSAIGEYEYAAKIAGVEGMSPV